MQTQKIRKNHMDILWHEYTDKGGEEIPVTTGKSDGESFDCRKSWDYASLLWNRSLESEEFYECSGRRDGDYLYSRYRPDVD